MSIELGVGSLLGERIDGVFALAARVGADVAFDDDDSARSRSSRNEIDFDDVASAVAFRSEFVDGVNSAVRFGVDENDDERWRTTVVTVATLVGGERSGDVRSGDDECGFAIASSALSYVSPAQVVA